MQTKTDLEKVKSIANNFIYLDMIQDEIMPFIVRHPYIESPFYFDGKEIKNILEDRTCYDVFVADTKRKIENVREYSQFAAMITKPYRSAFLSFTKKYIDTCDLAQYLKILWLSTETVNVDKNISKSEYVRLFKRANRNYLMTEEERNILDSLPERITIYRGINSKTDHPVNGMSWTPERDTAVWFANRFSNSGGSVCQAEINKENILAYFDFEKETVVDYRKLENIKIETVDG